MAAGVDREAFVAEVNELLGGSCNHAGIDGWWHRVGTALGGQTPLGVVGDTTQLEPHNAEQVRALAAALIGPRNFI